VPTDAYVFVNCPTVGGDLDLSRLRGYAIADAHARFRRGRGEGVLFTLGFDTFATTPKPAEGQSADEWIATRCADLQSQVDGLGISFDWDRVLLTSDPNVYRWSQWLFTKLLEADQVYQRGGKGWYLRTTTFNEENDRRLDELDGWSDAARAAQRALLQRVDGSEFEAKALDGTALTLFTSHPEAIDVAEFVALSPSRPELDGWLTDEGVRQQVEDMRNRDWSGVALAELPVVEVEMSVQVPSVAQPLPVVVSPSVDARFGPAAVLGVPSADATDKLLAKGLPKLGGLAWKVESKPPKTTATVRYLAEDMPLSRGRAWGAPVPVVHCEQCGAVPVPADRLPVEPPADIDVTARGNALAERDDFLAAECPQCGAAAKRDPGTLHPRFGAAWTEVGLAVPAADRAESMFDHPELQRWLPTAQTIEDGEAGVALLDMRTVAKALRDAAALQWLADGEPHGPTVIHESFEVTTGPPANGSDPAAGDNSPPAETVVTSRELVEAYGSDAVRFALLYAAAPAKAFSGRVEAMRHSASFLSDLRAFAEPRLDSTADGTSIDRGDGLRRRLAAWCDTAVNKATENYEQLDMHRATRNVMELLARIQDFEQRVTEHRGEVAGADREAVTVALQVLVRLLTPLAPRLANELQHEPAPA